MMRMILIIIMILPSLSLFGQDYIGFTGSIDLANISSSDLFGDSKYRLTVSGGVNYHHFFKESVSWGVGFSFYQRGFRTETQLRDDQNNPTGVVTTKFNYQYVGLPFELGIRLGQRGYSFASAGIIPSVLVRAGTYTPSFESSGIIVAKEEIDYTDDVNRFDLAGRIEVGVGFNAGEKYWIYGSAAFQHSFGTITTDDYFPDSRVSHYAIIGSFGMRYRLK